MQQTHCIDEKGNRVVLSGQLEVGKVYTLTPASGNAYKIQPDGLNRKQRREFAAKARKGK